MKYYAADGQGPININCMQDAGRLGVIGAEEIQVHQVRLHLSAASAAEDFVTKIDSGIDQRFDVVLDTKAMNGLLDYVYRPSLPDYLRGNDDLIITKTNAAALTWSVVVVYDKV
jgi:hypothetical protein